ncbi:hypothetical protein [Nostoc sp. FACHB-110]|uniref:hypothetical protein n=1 Tax=Nostoc sp. FACHB-110 TaxID=2692834 RepID=UPI0016895E05|nr:hypothetical protein [Nostoc sp. FACHB-110]
MSVTEVCNNSISIDQAQSRLLALKADAVLNRNLLFIDSSSMQSIFPPVSITFSGFASASATLPGVQLIVYFMVLNV